MSKTSRCFIGTHFDTESWKDTVTKLNESLAPRALDAQLEKCPDTGRLHIQLKVWLASPIRTSGLIKHLKCTWKIVGKDNCPDYAIKEQTRVEGPLQFGIKPKNGGDRKSMNFRELITKNYEDIQDFTPFQALQWKKCKAL